MKWVLPVQQSYIDGVDDYFINLPDDLLEQAGWKEGDTLEWIDKDDGSIVLQKVEVPMEKSERRERALTLFHESVLKPDHALRQCAHNQECYHELMEWREEIIQYLQKRRQEEFHE